MAYPNINYESPDRPRGVMTPPTKDDALRQEVQIRRAQKSSKNTYAFTHEGPLDLWREKIAKSWDIFR